MLRKSVRIKDSILVGNGAPTALNVLVGANSGEQYSEERSKLKALFESNLPITLITDLSLTTPPEGEMLWQTVVRQGRFAAGTVPVYQAVTDQKTIDQVKLLETIQYQMEYGVRLITIHPTPNMELLEKSKRRLVPITSRGGAAVCMDLLNCHRPENIYLELLDDIIKASQKNGVILSIGSSFRSANIHDACDSVYYLELEKQLEIADYCNKRNVSVVIETPGHASPQDIFKICDFLWTKCPYPIMPLGPLPTDCAFEQDDLAAAIGAVLMGTRGCADILTIVTKDEHLGGIPSVESILQAAKKYSVAKHIIDIYKIQDTAHDDETAKLRSQRASCVLAGCECSRCGSICPLNFASVISNSN